MKTVVLSKKDIKREWFLIDAKGQPLGRLASKIAKILMGKHKPTYTPFIDTGDYVVVINAKDVKLTGRKEKTKKYYQYSGYVGGMRETGFKEMIARHPEFPIEKAVKGMLPKNNLARQMFKKLRVFADDKHGLNEKTLKKIEL